ncbi:MAG: Zn-ribbon domain-containing OB-fold protein [Candidatus Diapherotrites archaeon]|nr:Zn-ribbon domain-containing OB-fold protein [Candidatus Diapherotrites archaeon]
MASNSISLMWRGIQQRYNLIGTKCKTCGQAFFPPRKNCPKCRRKGQIEELKFSGNGKVFSHSVVHAPPEGFENQVPYIISLVELEEGPLVTAQIVDCEPSEIQIGTKVKKVFRRVSEGGKSGIINYGYKFVLDR